METFMAVFMDPHLTHEVLILSNIDLNNVPFSRNLTSTLDEGLLYKLWFNIFIYTTKKAKKEELHIHTETDTHIFFLT
jgi:hypothetical protein